MKNRTCYTVFLKFLGCWEEMELTGLSNTLVLYLVQSTQGGKPFSTSLLYAVVSNLSCVFIKQHCKQSKPSCVTHSSSIPKKKFENAAE